MIYSIAKTAKANQLDVYQYLELLLTEIPKHMDDNNIRLLMICFSGHLQYKKSAQASIKSLNFSKYKNLYQTTIGPAEMQGFPFV